MDTSFIFHPTTHRLPVPACPRSLYLSSSPTSYSSLTVWRHLGHSHYLLLSVPLSFFPAQPPSSRSREETGTRFPPFLRRCYSLFLLFFVSFLSASILLPRSVRPHPPFFLSALFSFLFHHFFSVLTGSVEYFGNYSGRFRLFFQTRNISRLYYSHFPFAFISA